MITRVENAESNLTPSRRSVHARGFHTHQAVGGGPVLVNGVAPGAPAAKFLRGANQPCPAEIHELGEKVHALQQKLITICAWTRKIEYEGRWVTFEEFLLRALNIRVSHGMSPAVFQEFMAQLEAEATSVPADQR